MPNVDIPTAISIDIETYGAASTDWQHRPLPEQTVFHPVRSLLTDGVSRDSLILTASITLLQKDPRRVGGTIGQWSASSLSELEVGDTMVLLLNDKKHVRILKAWLEYADTLFGMNLLFDVCYLRTLPLFRSALNGRHTIIDLSIVNYLEDEFRPEKSLKNLGPVLHTHIYKETLKHTKFAHPSDERLHLYNGQDTHNTLLAIKALAGRILERYGEESAKLSAPCVEFYSRVFWSTLRMQEAGIPLRRTTLESMEEEYIEQCAALEAKFIDEYDFPLKGEGSGTAKTELIPDLISELEDIHSIPCPNPHCEDGVLAWNGDPCGKCKGSGHWFPPLNCPSLTDSRLLEKTKKLGIPSAGKRNRQLFTALFPEDSPRRAFLSDWADHTSKQKILTSYLCPLLRHKSGKPHIQTARGLPNTEAWYADPRTDICYSTWYLVPTSAKDDQGDEGGQRQGRLACRNPGAQTFPPLIKQTSLRSRYRGGTVFSFDLKQIELYVAAIMSGEPTLLTPIHEGLDLHTERAKLDFGDEVVELDDFSSKWRKTAKHANFTDLNLGGASVLQATILKLSGTIIPFSLCKQVVDNRANVRPRLYEWQQSIIELGSRQGYVELPYTGQSHAFIHGLDGNKPNEIVNFPIQCTAANVNLHIQWECHKRLPDLNATGARPLMFLNVYDALCFDCPPGTEEKIKALYADAIQAVRETYWAFICNHYGNEVPLGYDCDIYKDNE